MKKVKFKKIIALVLSTILLVMSFCIHASAYGIGSQIVYDSDGNKLYDLYMWNVCDQSNNEYSLYGEYTQYAASDYTAAVLVVWVYGYDLGSQSWVDSAPLDYVEYCYQSFHEFWYTSTALSKDGRFVYRQTDVTNMIPSTANTRVYLGYYSSTSSSTYSIVYHDAPSSRLYLNIVQNYTFEKPWNFG